MIGVSYGVLAPILFFERQNRVFKARGGVTTSSSSCKKTVYAR